MSIPSSASEEEEVKRGSHASEETKPSFTGHDKQEAKANSGQFYSAAPLESSFRPSIGSLSDISTYSADNENERRASGPLALERGSLASRSSRPAKAWKGRVDGFWARNKGLVLVILAQLFGALMSVTTRLLETEGSHGLGMDPFQVIAAMLYNIDDYR